MGNVGEVIEVGAWTRDLVVVERGKEGKESGVVVEQEGKEVILREEGRAVLEET